MTELEHEEINKEPEHLQEVPLIHQTTKNQKQSINNENQRFLVILDVTICFTVITFLVVACWRGTWELMNIYYKYLPMWETFIVATFAHVTFALGQNVFHEVFLDSNEKRFIIKAVHFFVRRFYLFVFYLVGIAQWSSLWTILDTYFRAYISEILLPMSLVFLVLIGALTNICSTPTNIIIDEKDGTFLFETGFFYKLIYLAIYFTGSNQMDNTSNSNGLPKQLFQAPNLSEDNAQTLHPKPFIVEFSGPHPRKFTPTPTPTTTPTTKKATTLIYPQLTNYRNRYYPKNIQEILKHIKNDSMHPTQNYARNTGKRHASNPEHTNSYTTDIFQLYKPKDPSEVNLLATGRVRFSPPVWKDFRRFEGQQNNHQPPLTPTITRTRNPPHLIPLNHSFVENVPILLTNENQMTNIMNQFVNFRGSVKRPMSITLNLYPMETSYVSRNDPKSSDSNFHEISKEPESKLINLGVSNLDGHIVHE